LNVEIQNRERFFVLGPSGGGKTTLLRLLAGFLQPDSGEICFAGKKANQVPPHLRPVALVSQQPALWPHLTVADNLGYGLDVRGIRDPERRQRIAEVLTLVRLEDLQTRFPAELSGGQQQRVALARALIIRPEVLLLDEPLANLDPPLRSELREELRRIHAALQVTLVCVTHDRQDALHLADRAAVLKDGRFEQIAPPSMLFDRPATRFVADFLGDMNWFSGNIRKETPQGLEIETDLGMLQASSNVASRDERVWVGFRPRHLQLVASTLNSFPAMPRRQVCAGEYDEWVMETTGGKTLKLHHSGRPGIQSEAEFVTVSVDPQDLIVLPRD